ncbi:MAG: MFS transporter [Actinomycetota bacterium]
MLMTELASEGPAGAGAAPSRSGGLDSFVAAIAVGQVVSWGVLYYAFSVLLVPMQRQLGWPRPVLVGGFTVAVVISGLLATTVGRRLDHGSSRLVMGAGSAFAVVVVVAWSQARSVPVYYLAWAGIGVAMALVLYEPAFTVIAKRYAPHHHRPLTAVTLIAGTASFVFQPLTSTLASAYGWRIALVLLAAILAAITLPIHLRLLPHAPAGRPQPPDPAVARHVTDRRFWNLTAAFTCASVTSFGTSVLLVAYLIDHGWTLGGAAMAGGMLGIMQLPGRLLFAPLHARLDRRTLTRLTLGLPGFGVVLLLLSGGKPLVWAAIPVLGMTQGLNTLLRVTLLVDLYGTARFGALNGRSASPVVLARALAPLGAASLGSATGGYAVPFALLAAVAGLAGYLGGNALMPEIVDGRNLRPVDLTDV